MDGCADVGAMEARRKTIATKGYQLLGDFVLPAAGWWYNYYVPLAECLMRFRVTHAAEILRPWTLRPGVSMRSTCIRNTLITSATSSWS